MSRNADISAGVFFDAEWVPVNAVPRTLTTILTCAVFGSGILIQYSIY
jgi:hypothetical protein